MKDEARAEQMARLQRDLEVRAADAAQGAALRQLKQIMMRLMKGEAAMRVEVWRGAVKMMHQQKLLAGAVKRLMMRKLSMALEKWQTMAAESKAQHATLRMALMRLLNGKLAAAVGAWRAMAADMMLSLIHI